MNIITDFLYFVKLECHYFNSNSRNCSTMLLFIAFFLVSFFFKGGGIYVVFLFSHDMHMQSRILLNKPIEWRNIFVYSVYKIVFC
ncbi:Protein of unknown function [Gryllus bimaculatus]|nr:Protein of unknown function [Gryllus bimaculatus]